MNLLIDTHVLLWALDDDPLLSSAARAAITDGRNLVFVSAATAWEIVIKKALGKLRAPTESYLDELPLHAARHHNTACAGCRDAATAPHRPI